MRIRVRYAVRDGQVVCAKYVLSDKPAPCGALAPATTPYVVTTAHGETITYGPNGEVVSVSGKMRTPFRWAGANGFYKDSSPSIPAHSRVQVGPLASWFTRLRLEEASGSQEAHEECEYWSEVLFGKPKIEE